MKRCLRCNTAKDETEFYRNKVKKDGLAIYCKACSNIAAAASRARHPGRRRTADLAYYQRKKESNIEAFKERSREAKKKYARQYSARLLVRDSIRAGRLEPVTQRYCETCGKIAEQYHHPDYSKPLEVVPLCAACHVKLHAALKK
jgi:flagellar motility protein MotE (MotC chaperone)